MSTAQDQWEIFWDWQRNICLHHNPGYLIVQLRIEARQQFDRIGEPAEYIRSLQDLQRSIKTVESRNRQVRVCRRGIEDRRARSGFWSMTSVPIEAHQELKQAIKDYLESLRLHAETIRGFEYEQEQLDTEENPIGNEMTRQHLAKLSEDTNTSISEAEIQLGDCRQLLAQRGVPATPERDDTRPEQQEQQEEGVGEGGEGDDDGSRDDRRHEQEDPVTSTSRRSRADPGAETPAGSDGDGERDPHKPVANPNIVEPDVHNEAQKNTDEYEYNALGEDVQPPARSDRRSAGSLRSFEHYEKEAQVPPPPAGRSVGVSQRPGANQIAPTASGQVHTSRGRRQMQGGKWRAQNSDDNSSSDNPNESSEPGRSDRERSNKRRESDEDRSGVDGDQRRPKRKKTASGAERPENDLDAEAVIRALPRPVHEYYLRAIAPESTLMLDKRIIAEFVLRLYRAFGDRNHWADELPIQHYLTDNGDRRPGQAMDVLRRREFDQGWARFFSDLPAEHEPLRRTYEDIRDRLEAANARYLPPRPQSDPARALGWFRMRVIEAENPDLYAAWDRYARVVGERKGPAAGQMAQYAYEAMLKRVRDEDYEAYLPPPSRSPAPPRTSDRPLPGRAMDDPKRVTKEAQRLGFVVNEIPGNWTFLITLNIGGFGHAGLWVEYDVSGKIIDRKVAKETYLGPHWNSEQYWMPRMQDGEDRIPREFYIGAILADCDQSYNIIGPITYAVYPERYLYRLYMDYCACGDLEDLIRNHVALGQSGAMDQEGNPVSLFIPIPVVWCIFEALASAVCLMKDGCLSGDEPQWESIFHRDMKPRNVFLDSPDSTVWRGIPVPKLGDFGLALESNPGNVGPPSLNSIDVGTPGYKAPEAEIYDPRLRIPFYEYSSASDIFVVGRIMLSLINLQTHSTVRQYRFDDYDDVPSADDAARGFYPRVLLDLVDACLRRRPGDRITANQLYLDIKEQVTACTGLRDIPWKFRTLEEGDVLHLRPDPYLAWAK